jgi:hypothetical protein
MVAKLESSFTNCKDGTWENIFGGSYGGKFATPSYELTIFEEILPRYVAINLDALMNDMHISPLAHMNMTD